MPLQTSVIDDSLCATASWCAAACVDDRYSAIPILECSLHKREVAFFPVVSVSNQPGIAVGAPLESSINVYNKVSNDQRSSTVTLDNSRSYDV